MKRNVQYGFLSHIFLVFCIIFIGLSFIFRGNTFLQFGLVFFSLILYLIFSAVHHYLDKSLTFEVIFEYILIGALALMVMFGIAL